jgi:Ca-activated chloride channel homolog
MIEFYWGIRMLKPTAIAALLTFVVALTLTGSPPRAQDRGDINRVNPDRVNLDRITAIAAPPLIQSQDAKAPIRLRSASMEVETDGGLARTVVQLTLSNPNDRVLEGALQFPLQPGQQVTAFALDIEGAMRDAVPVPKQKAQQVFESIERRNVDPGLLEQTAGNHFRLRVYPIPPRGTRQVRLVIDEAMRRDGKTWRLDLPVHLMDEADALSLSVRARGLDAAPVQSGSFDALRFEHIRGGFRARHEVLRERLSGHSQRRLTTLGLRLPSASTAQAYVQRFDGERFAMVELPVPAAVSVARTLPKAVGLLWDASASARHRDRQSEYALLDRYFTAMRNGRVVLRALRDVGEGARVYEIRDGDWSALRSALDALVYDGASDLADWAAEPEIGEYLLFSDGLRTYGDAPFPKLQPGQALYALSSAGAKTDAARLAALAEARGGRFVQWQGRGGVDAAARMLLESGTRIVGLEGDGIEDLQPQAWDIDGGLLRIAGRMTDASASLRVKLSEAGKTRTIEIPIAADAPESARVAALWASWRIASRAEDVERHRAEIARMGQRFGIVTPGTSLLVLEAAEDYVRYDIAAPSALRERVAELKRTQNVEREQSRNSRIDEVAARFAQRIEWWQRDYPKNLPVAPKPNPREEAVSSRSEAQRQRSSLSEPAAEAAAVAADAAIAGAESDDTPAVVGDASAGFAEGTPPPPPPAPPLASPVAAPAPDLDRVSVTGSRVPGGSRSDNEPALMLQRKADDRAEATAGHGVSIQLQPWESDSPYARRLRAAEPDQIYALYLDERDSHAESTAYYLDVGDLLLRKGRRAEALRVLSNLAELDLENRHILRVLGYRLMQAKDWRRATEVFREVLRLADEEPQSHRDLGLALAAAGERQEAIERLYEVIVRPWDSRFSEVDAVALNELNAIVANGPALNTQFIDRRLIKNMPLDLRVVLAWDSDNSDMDLWVTDPNGERCYYGHRNTYQGGLLSDDFTGGYGPEEFVLKDAKPGKYKVEANFFGDRQQIVTGATTLSLNLSTGWGTARQQNQAVTLRLSGKSETVMVGEFEVK